MTCPSRAGAWREMRQTWRRQQKDPDYQLDTPCQPPPGPACRPPRLPRTTPLEASIGDLAPEALQS